MNTPSFPNVDDRLLESFRAMVRAETVALRLQYSGRYAYTIVGVNGDNPNLTIDCTAQDTTLGLPDLNGLDLQRQAGGLTATPDVGMTCVVIFLNRDPSLPRVTNWGSSGLNPVARLGDQVVCYMPPQIQFVAAIAPYGPVTGYFELTGKQNVTAFITVGSDKAYSG